MRPSVYSHDDLKEAIKHFNVARVSTLLAAQPNLANTHDEEIDKPMAWLLQQDWKTDEETVAVLAIAELLLQAGVDVNQPINLEGKMALYVAVQREHMALVMALLSRGANINAVHRSHAPTAMSMAIVKGNTTLFQEFLARGADFHHDDIKYAMMSRKVSMVEALFAQGVDLHYRCSAGSDLLFLAVTAGSTTIVDYLLQRGLDPNRVQAYGRLPLNYAALARDYAMVQCLIQAGANLNGAEAPDGNTALHYAAYMGNLREMELLIDAGADINVQTANGATPLHLAAEHYQEQAIRLLLKRGADINKTNAQGLTPLAHATYRGAYNTPSILARAHTLQELSRHMATRFSQRYPGCAEPVFEELEVIYQQKQSACMALQRPGLDINQLPRLLRAAGIGLFSRYEDPITKTGLPMEIQLKIAQIQLETQHDACLRLNATLGL